MAKAKGAEIFDFYTNGWPEGWYHDDNEMEIVNEDGETCALEPDEEYDLSLFGVLVPEGDRMVNGDLPDPEGFATAFSRWKRAKTTAIVIVEVPKAQLDEALKQIKALGYKAKK